MTIVRWEQGLGARRSSYGIYLCFPGIERLTSNLVVWNVARLGDLAPVPPSRSRRPVRDDVLRFGGRRVIGLPLREVRDDDDGVVIGAATSPSE
jgi:hypothetical protein